MLRIHGHRGCRAVYPENSIEGVQAAFACGAFAVEVDVHLTADNDFVVVHDEELRPGYYKVESPVEVSKSELPFLETITFGHERLKRFPEQKQLQTRVPSLKKLVQLFPSHKFIVEVKMSDPKRAAHTAEQFKGWLDRHQYIPFRVQSFSMEFLEAFYRLNDEVPCHWLIEEKTELTKPWPSWLNGVGLQYKLINEEVLRRTKEEGVDLAAWTVNSIEKGEALRDLGVTELISDSPQLLMALND